MPQIQQIENFILRSYGRRLFMSSILYLIKYDWEELHRPLSKIIYENDVHGIQHTLSTWLTYAKFNFTLFH